MTTRLQVYNGALRILGEPRLTSLSEDRPPRYEADAIWDDGFVTGCLEQGQWRFATRTVQMDADTSIEPDFGYTQVFAVPDDYVRLCGISGDPYFNDTLTRYSIERGYFYADYSPIYIKYVSNHADYGSDLAAWPESFSDLAQAILAEKLSVVVTQREGTQKRVEQAMARARANARSLDAMQDSTKFMPMGTWVRARLGSRSRRIPGQQDYY